MDLTWIVVVIVGCVALAVCIGLVLLRPMNAERRRLRPLANVGRLTRLPEYVRAKRARTITAVVTIALLVVTFAGAVVAGARPTGFFTRATPSTNDDPEDVMLCMGAPVTDRAVGAALGWFADRADDLGTERVGLTSLNRRVVPLTRDYQYLKQTLSSYAQPSASPGDLEPFAPAVSYSDYAETFEDQLALCLTGFPDFEHQAAQRRSLVYVGPGTSSPSDGRPSLFTADRVRQMALAAGVQVNALVTDGDPDVAAALARDTGGRESAAASGVTARLAEIRNSPPERRSGDTEDAGARTAESPDVPLVVALLAVTALAAWPLVGRS